MSHKTASLELFHPCTSNWFERTLGTPTPVQEETWPAIAAGKHTLVSAPTGTGKTLSAFLIFIDRLKTQAREGTLKQELSLIYISPLKSLAGDIRENLRRPLDGIAEEEVRAGFLTTEFQEGISPNKTAQLSIAIRTGDTTQADRRKMIKTPPHILITTPESLYLMLTSQSGKKILYTAQAIIIDELHALIDSKRGAHLMLSIARLDQLCNRPLQRIGLSATIEPLSTAAEYLSPDPVTIVAPRMHKDIRLMVTSPYSDTRTIRKDTVWQEISATVYEFCEGTRSAIAFVEGRAYAEKLAYFINQLGGNGFARTHHGSLSKEQRFEAENDLRSGKLRLLCATSSMELGIDVGDIDQVFQIGCPRTISSTMQRLGRAGHNPNRTSIMYLFPREPSEGLYCGLTAEVARNGGVEHLKPPRLCFDILSQHLVSMANGEGYPVSAVMELLPRAYPFRDVTIEDVRNILCMLSGDYEHERDIPVRPRLLYDRIHDRVSGDPYSRMLAVSAGGTIPDRGLYAAKTEQGVKIGELDEEFVFEARTGDRFLLGTFAWQIISIQRDTVIVRQTMTASARLPFWHGDMKGRRMRTGIAFGELLRRLNDAEETGMMLKELGRLGLDDACANSAYDYLKRQISSTGVLPDDRTILVEHFRDENGSCQLMVHSVFGRPVNEPLSLLARETAKRYTNTTINCVEDDDGFLLMPYDGSTLPEGLLKEIVPDTARKLLEAMLPATPLFNMNFRYNTARALMMGVRGNKRQPLWLQRLKSAEILTALLRQKNHPLIRETIRECLEDYWDLPGVEYILNGIRSGSIHVSELYHELPSPMSLPLRRQTEASMMYDYAPQTEGIAQTVKEDLQQSQLLAPEPEQLAHVSERMRLPKDEDQLHSLLMIEGDLAAGELEVPVEWLEALARRELADYIEPGLWIAAEQKKEYEAALLHGDTEARKHLVRRLLRYRSAHSAMQVAERYLWTQEEAENILASLCRQQDVIEAAGIYYHAVLYERARQETVKNRRGQIETLPAARYAALMADRMFYSEAAPKQLELALKALSGQPFGTELWEGILLPARVSGYRPELLDTALSGGNYYWQLNSSNELSIYQYEDIDWDATLDSQCEELSGNDKILYEALLKRGASFMQRLSGLVEGEYVYDILMRLAREGLVCADSFMPVRQLLSNDRQSLRATKQRAGARAKAQTTGRWELSRPLLLLTVEQQLERAFDRSVILCRETLKGMQLSWVTALETLRIWEYTGRVRRGYFIEGLSGIQFIRDKDFAGIMQELKQPRNRLIWMSAIDPAQIWGKSIPHIPDKAFMNIAGTAVVLNAGIPAAVIERQGKVLRVFDDSVLPEALQAFAADYAKRRIFPSLNRITVKQYPKEAADALAGAGFLKELQDYVLYRSYH